MLELVRSLSRNRRLLKEFVVRDLKARYVGSSMGFFWSVVFPVINLVVYLFVFQVILNTRWSDKQGATEVALIMLAGIVVWAAFAETISRSTNTLVENQNLIQKVVFPSEVLPVYLTISAIVNMCIGLPVVLLCTFWLTIASPPDIGFGDQAQRLGERGGATVVQVQLDRGHRNDVDYQIDLGGTAELGSDYDIEFDQATIPVGSVLGEVRIVPRPDDQAEGEETIVLTFAPSDVDVDPERQQHVVTLTDGAEPGRAARGPDEDTTYRPLDMGWQLVALPLLFFLQLVFTTGLGYFLATLNVFLRDTYHLVGVFVTVWMFGTPIFYSAKMVDDAGFGQLLNLNPMHWLIEAYRSVLLFGQWPDFGLTLRFAIVALVVLFLGSRFFMSQKRRFPDLL